MAMEDENDGGTLEPRGQEGSEASEESGEAVAAAAAAEEEGNGTGCMVVRGKGSDGGGGGGEELVERDDGATQASISFQLSEPTTIPTEAQPSKEDSKEAAMDAGPARNLESRRLSLKRSRQHCLEDTPSIRVSYINLTSESKKKLKEFLRQWAEWQSKNEVVAGDLKRGSLECGEEEYFPAFQVGEENSLTVHFWMDKPSKKACVEHLSHEVELARSEEGEKDVPLYDRACAATLISEEATASLQGALKMLEEDSRCFNCGSYSHSLKDCMRPRDNTAINNARKMHLQKRGSSTGPRVTSRYYQSSPGGKFDDLKPGVLGSETRQSLGIGELDPPPWLNRMRELGYPPGYMEEPDEPSGITIFGTNDDSGAYLGEDGEITGISRDQKKLSSAAELMMVDFPGLNAPIPENADERKWAPPRNLRSDTQYAVPATKMTDRKSLRSTRFSATAVTADGVEHTGYADGISSSDTIPATGHDLFKKNYHVRPSPSDRPVGSAHKLSKGKADSMERYRKSNDRDTHFGKPCFTGRSATDSCKSPYEEHYPLPPLSGPRLVGRQSNIMHSSQAYGSPQSMRMHSPQSYHSPHSGQQQSLSPGWRTSYNWDPKDDPAEARRKAWAQAHEALAASHRSESSERSSSRRR